MNTPRRKYTFPGAPRARARAFTNRPNTHTHTQEPLSCAHIAEARKAIKRWHLSPGPQRRRRSVHSEHREFSASPASRFYARSQTPACVHMRSGGPAVLSNTKSVRRPDTRGESNDEHTHTHTTAHAGAYSVQIVQLIRYMALAHTRARAHTHTRENTLAHTLSASCDCDCTVVVSAKLAGTTIAAATTTTTTPMHLSHGSRTRYFERFALCSLNVGRMCLFCVFFTEGV